MKSNEEKNREWWEQRVANETWRTYNSLEEKNRALLDFYMKASEKIRKELYTLAEQISVDGVLTRTEMYEQQRLQKLEKKYRDIAYDLGKQVEQMATGNMQSGFQDVYKNVAISMGDIDYTMPNKKLMEKLLNNPWRGDTFSGRLWGNQKKLAVGLNDILQTGLQQGLTVTEMAIRLNNFIGQSFNVCHRLVRTETMHYLNCATMQRYKDAGVEYVQIIAAQDERTCKECGKYHLKVYPIDKCPVLPFHANCRCTIIPCFDEELISKYKKEFISKDDELQNYEKVDMDKNNQSDTTRGTENIIAYKSINSVNNIYISKDIKLKPKQLHKIDTNISRVVKILEAEKNENLPKVIVVNNTQMQTGAVASYNPLRNLLYLDEKVGIKEQLLELQKDCASPENELSTILHEYIHWEDAEQYRKKHGEIKDVRKYLEELRRKCKRSIDDLETSGYNINEISEYASRMYDSRRYDEVLTEYKVKRTLKR